MRDFLVGLAAGLGRRVRKGQFDDRSALFASVLIGSRSHYWWVGWTPSLAPCWIDAYKHRAARGSRRIISVARRVVKWGDSSPCSPERVEGGLSEVRMRPCEQSVAQEVSYATSLIIRRGASPPHVARVDNMRRRASLTCAVRLRGTLAQHGISKAHVACFRWLRKPPCK